MKSNDNERFILLGFSRIILITVCAKDMQGIDEKKMKI